MYLHFEWCRTTCYKPEIVKSHVPTKAFCLWASPRKRLQMSRNLLDYYVKIMVHLTGIGKLNSLLLVLYNHRSHPYFILVIHVKSYSGKQWTVQEPEVPAAPVKYPVEYLFVRIVKRCLPRHYLCNAVFSDQYRLSLPRDIVMRAWVPLTGLCFIR